MGVRERGSVLALVPAAFLVLIFLAALAVDSAVAFQARSQLHDAVIGAANDAVTAGIDQQTFYSGGGVHLDAGAVGTVVCQAIDAEGLSSFHGLRVAVAISGESVRVVATGSVDAVFGRAIPGFASRQVSASAEAVAQSAAAGGAEAPAPAFPPLTTLDC